MAGGWAVSVVPSTVSRSKPAVWPVPGTVTSSISSPSPLKTVTSPTNGSTGGPKPVTAVRVPPPMRLSAGQAAVPRARSSSSLAVHFAAASWSIRVPSGRRKMAPLIGGGLAFGSSGSR